MGALKESFPKLTPDEYFAWEEGQNFRHEYISGEVYAMSGGTIDHSEIAGNFLALLKVPAIPNSELAPSSEIFEFLRHNAALCGKFVRQQRLVSVDFQSPLQDDLPNFLEAPQAVLLSDIREPFHLLSIFPSSTFPLAFAFASQ